MFDVSVYWNIAILILCLPLDTMLDCKIYTICGYLNYDWYSTRCEREGMCLIKSFFNIKKKKKKEKKSEFGWYI
jgi:hypothetical protein